MTDPAPTALTWRTLERVGRALGAQEGTGPDDTPLLRTLSEQAQAEGQAAGRAEELAALVRSALQVRGIPVSSRSEAGLPSLVDIPRDVLMAAALACVDEEDFRRRVGSAD